MPLRTPDSFELNAPIGSPRRRKGLRVVRQIAPAPVIIAVKTAQLPQLAADYLSEFAGARQGSPRTVERYKFVTDKLYWFLTTFGHDACGVKELRAWFVYATTAHERPEGRWQEPGSLKAGRGNYAHLRPISARSVRSYHADLRAFFRWLVQEEVLSSSPMERIKAPALREEQVKPFTEADLQALQAAITQSPYPTRDRAIFLFLLDTGARASEFCSLTYDAIDMSARRATILGKGGKRRDLYWTTETSHALRAYAQQMGRTGGSALFLAEGGPHSGFPLTRGGLLKIVRTWGVKAKLQGVRCSPHTFRHAQPLTSPVLTPGGWTTMGELRVGDQVIGSDGKPTEVVGIYPQGAQKVVRLSFDDQSTVECTMDHLWSVWEPAVRRWPRYPITPKVLSTKEIIDSGERWHFPVVAPVEFALSPELPIDPYILGAMLGDGHFGTSLVLSGGDGKIGVLERVGQSLPAGYHVSGDGMLHTLSAPGKPRVGYNMLLTKAQGMGLIGMRSATKSIPSIYLQASIADRIQLLRGLMDTDGTGTTHASAEYATISRQLASDIVELTRSLGGLARIRETVPYKGAKNNIYRVSIRTPFNPFHLARKKERYESRPKQPFVRSMISHESTGGQECVCIQVASPDQLYVTKDYVVTHNTFATMFLRAGGSQLALMQALGHTNLEMTRRYVMFAEADRAAQARQFSPVAMLREYRLKQ